MQIERPEEFYMWLSTMTKAAFIFGCWKKLQTEETAKRKEFPLAVPRTPTHRGGNSPCPLPPPQPGALPGGARFPTTSTRHNYTGQTVKRPCSQQRFAIKIAFLPILLLRAERCGGVEAPPDRCLGLNP